MHDGPEEARAVVLWELSEGSAGVFCALVGKLATALVERRTHDAAA